MSVRPSAAAFHPQDPSAPIMAYCAAGSGLAPIQGFIQMSERATQKVSGREVGKIFLFYGCHSPDADFLCADSDLAKWQKLGVVDIRPAFSRATEKSEGCRYVQDRVYHDREDVEKMFAANAQVIPYSIPKFIDFVLTLELPVLYSWLESDREGSQGKVCGDSGRL
ncbi:hypothetical protein PQX77_010921 [Marasmius sp. AFHP31]|nr:hypothetical protein PQX77_010921 [Marasmius sp. AFHP31]